MRSACRKMCSKGANRHFLDSSRVFLTSSGKGIDAKLTPDALHPSAAGLQPDGWVHANAAGKRPQVTACCCKQQRAANADYTGRHLSATWRVPLHQPVLGCCHASRPGFLASPAPSASWPLLSWPRAAPGSAGCGQGCRQGTGRQARRWFAGVLVQRRQQACFLLLPSLLSSLLSTKRHCQAAATQVAAAAMSVRGFSKNSGRNNKRWQPAVASNGRKPQQEGAAAVGSSSSPDEVVHRLLRLHDAAAPHAGDELQQGQHWGAAAP